MNERVSEGVGECSSHRVDEWMSNKVQFGKEVYTLWVELHAMIIKR